MHHFATRLTLVCMINAHSDSYLEFGPNMFYMPVKLSPWFPRSYGFRYGIRAREKNT